MGAVLRMQSWVVWKDYISQPSYNILPAAASFGLFLPQEHITDTRTTCWLSGCRDPLCQAAFQLVRPQLVLMWGFVPPKMQDLAFFWRLLSVQLSSLSHASGWSTTPPSFVLPAICINMHKLPCCIWADTCKAFPIVSLEHKDLACIIPGLFSAHVSHVSFLS